MIPSKELIGQNASLNNGVYSDDYMIALNKFASVDEVLGKDKEGISKRRIDPIARIVMGTLGRSEYENHIGELLIVAANRGEWSAIERNHHQNSLDVITKKHFGHVATYQDRTFLLPSAMYVTFCAEHKRK